MSKSETRAGEYILAIQEILNANPTSFDDTLVIMERQGFGRPWTGRAMANMNCRKGVGNNGEAALASISQDLCTSCNLRKLCPIPGTKGFRQ